MEVWVEMCSESGAHRGSLKLSAKNQIEVAGHTSSSVSMREHVCAPGTLPGNPGGSVCTRWLQVLLQTLAVLASSRYVIAAFSNAKSIYVRVHSCLDMSKARR